MEIRGTTITAFALGISACVRPMPEGRKAGSKANDPAQDGAPGWNLAHVVAHLTAELEENAIQASTLAGGTEITSASQLQQRLAESRRMVLTYLDTWPDEPRLDTTYDRPRFGQMNVLAYMALSLNHAKGRLPRIQEILRQAEARITVRA